MPEESPYVTAPLKGANGRLAPQADSPMPDLQFARPRGAWVIVGALFIAVVGLWAFVATYFSLRA